MYAYTLKLYCWGFTKKTDIAKAFFDNFASVCSHNSLYRITNSEFAKYRASDDPSQCLFGSVAIQMAIDKLQVGKAPGIDGVIAEHVLYCNPLISFH